jgi:hypothetical protein
MSVDYSARSFHMADRTVRRVVSPVLTFSLVFLPLGTCDAQADCNRNGTVDLEDIAAGLSVDCNSNGRPDECELEPLRLSLLEGDVGLLGSPRAFFVADLSGDGLSDLVTLQDAGAGSSVGILRSRSDATFVPLQASDAGEEGVAAAILDWNRDGAMDIAVSGPGAVQILPGDGGSIASPRVLAQPGGSVLLAADVTGDGELELLVAAADGLSVLRYVDDSTVERRTTVLTLAAPTAMATADYDGDGNLDVALVARTKGVVTVLHGRGDGDFERQGTHELGTNGPHAIAAGDLDRDGDNDLVIGVRSAVLFLRNEAPNFGVPVRFPSGGPLTSIVLGDFDGDSDLDLLSATTLSNAIDVWQNDGDGPRLDTGSLGAGWSPRRLATGDFNGDGRLDVAAVVGNAEVTRATVLINDLQTPPAGLEFQTSNVRVTGKPHAITMGDFNRDGLLDVATCNGGQGSFSVLFGTADGDVVISRTYIPEERAALFTITNGDYDGDGDLDLAAGDVWGEQAILRTNAGDGTFFNVSFTPLGAAPALLISADVDGNGLTDLLSANSGANTVSIAPSAGGGLFEPPRQLRVGSRPLAVAAHDLDADGDLDLAVASSTVRELSVHRNQGEGTFEAGRSYPVIGAARHVVAGDLDGSGEVELLVAHDSWVTVFRSEGDGGFAEELTVDTRQDPYSLVVTDVDGDTVPDIVTSNTTHPAYGSLSVFLGHGVRQYRPPFRLVVGAEPRFTVAGDLDQDGDLDLVSANRTSENITMLRNEQSTFPDFTMAICTALDFHKLAVDTEEYRTLRFLVPTATGAPHFQNGWRYRSHVDFLREVFPEIVAGFSEEALRAELEGGEGALYVAGALRRESPDRYGFDVLRADGSVATPAAVGAVYEALRAGFQLETLGYAPLRALDQTVARGWRDVAFPVFLESRVAEFRRGDANADGTSNIADAVAIVSYLFRSETAPTCLKGADLDDDGKVNLVDVVALLSFLHRNGIAPAAPHRDCGSDPTEDRLTCDAFGSCP